MTEHYENVLAGHYSWLFGGLEVQAEENRQWCLRNKAELCVGMGDALTRLDSCKMISKRFQQAPEYGEQSGSFFLTFRDLSNELTDLTRFLPLRSDPTKIFPC